MQPLQQRATSAKEAPACTVIQLAKHRKMPPSVLGKILFESRPKRFRKNEENLSTTFSNPGGSAAEWLSCWTQAQKGAQSRPTF